MNVRTMFRNGNHDVAGERGAVGAPTSDEAELPVVARYERLGESEAVAGLRQLEQVELTAIEAFERSHKARPAMLNKLRYLRQVEPFSGYDALDGDGVIDAMATADAPTVKAVRGYERKLRHRPTVLAEAARKLHTG